MIAMKVHTTRVALKPGPRGPITREVDQLAPGEPLIKMGWRATVDDGAFFVQADNEHEDLAVAHALKTMALHLEGRHAARRAIDGR